MAQGEGKSDSRNWLLWLLAGLVILALAGFAVVIAGQLLSGGSEVRSPQNSTENTTSEEPVSILPDSPKGVTVLEKQPEPQSDGSATILAPVAQGSDIASGFAMDLGSAGSFLELTQRFVSIVETNGEKNFFRLEPRAVLRETVTGLEARLLVGPFQSKNTASEACAVLILDPAIACAVAPFEGELIPRQ